MDAPRRHWFRFSLRTLLVVVTLVALPMGWFTNRLRQAERQRDIVAKLREMDFRVYYEWCVGPSFADSDEDKPAATWARKALGDDFFDRVIRVGKDEYGKDGFPDERDCPPDSESLRLVAALHDLEALDLSSRAGVDDSAAGQLESLRKLRMLNLSYTKVTNDGLCCLAGMPELETLFLKGASLSDGALIHLQSLHRLKYLDLDETRISGGQLECLNNLMNLETLRLTGTKIRLADFGKLRLPRLRKLSIRWFEYGPGATCETISPDVFGGLPNLETLDIQGYGAQPGLMAAIVRLSGLRDLDLTGVAVEDVDLEHIAQLQHLAVLKLRGARITDVGLRSLAQLPELAGVCLNVPLAGEPLSPRGFAELQRARPNLHIAFGADQSKFTLPGDTPP